MEKYVEALNNILGADNAYFRGDKDVDTIVELIQTVKSLNDERETMLKDLQFRTNQVIEQQAEIERLKYNCGCRLKNVKSTKSEAIKEFAERLKYEKHLVLPPDGYPADENDWVIYEDDIDNLVKEMVGDG